MGRFFTEGSESDESFFWADRFPNCSTGFGPKLAEDTDKPIELSALVVVAYLVTVYGEKAHYIIDISCKVMF
jgi:hypothetical protein